MLLHDVLLLSDVILDAEIVGFRSVTTRFWNPLGNRIRLSAEAGTVTFRKIRIRRLADVYVPYPVAATPGSGR